MRRSKSRAYLGRLMIPTDNSKISIGQTVAKALLFVAKTKIVANSYGSGGYIRTIKVKIEHISPDSRLQAEFD